MNKRQRLPTQEELNQIPQAVKDSLSKENLYELAAIVRSHEPVAAPDLGELTFAGTSRITGPLSQFNFFRDTGFFNSSNIPLNVLDVMRRDSQIALGMSIVKYPITNLGFTVNCESPIIKTSVQFMLDRIWSKMLRDMLLALDFGFAAFEKVWEREKLDIDPGLNQRKAKGRNFIMLRKLKPLHPKSISIDVDNLNNFEAIRQIGSGTAGGRDVVLNKQKSLLFTYQQEFGNFFGKSRMASAYEAWYWKIISTQFFLRYMERHSIPPYKVLYPKGKSNTIKGSLANAQIALNLAQAISSYGNVTVPSTRDKESKKLLWDIQNVEQSKQNITLKEIVEDVWNVAIMRGLLIPDEKSLGGISADAATKIFLSTLEDFANNVEEIINEEIIKPFIFWNFTEQEREVCKINIDDIDFEKREEMRKLLSKILDLSATFIKQKDGLPYNVFPDLNKILEILDIPGKPLALHQLKTIDPSGKDITKEVAKKNNRARKGVGKGPDKGEPTSGNQSRIGRNGSPRNEDKDDESNA